MTCVVCVNGPAYEVARGSNQSRTGSVKGCSAIVLVASVIWPIDVARVYAVLPRASSPVVSARAGASGARGEITRVLTSKAAIPHDLAPEGAWVEQTVIYAPVCAVTPLAWMHPAARAKAAKV